MLKTEYLHALSKGFLFNYTFGFLNIMAKQLQEINMKSFFDYRVAGYYCKIVTLA